MMKLSTISLGTGTRIEKRMRIDDYLQAGRLSRYPLGFASTSEYETALNRGDVVTFYAKDLDSVQAKPKMTADADDDLPELVSDDDLDDADEVHADEVRVVEKSKKKRKAMSSGPGGVQSRVKIKPFSLEFAGSSEHSLFRVLPDNKELQFDGVRRPWHYLKAGEVSIISTLMRPLSLSAWCFSAGWGVSRSRGARFLRHAITLSFWYLLSLSSSKFADLCLDLSLVA